MWELVENVNKLVRESLTWKVMWPEYYESKLGDQSLERQNCNGPILGGMVGNRVGGGWESAWDATLEVI